MNQHEQQQQEEYKHLFLEKELNGKHRCMHTDILFYSTLNHYNIGPQNNIDFRAVWNTVVVSVVEVWVEVLVSYMMTLITHKNF